MEANRGFLNPVLSTGRTFQHFRIYAHFPVAISAIIQHIQPVLPTSLISF
jgi:hypothetical protein